MERPHFTSLPAAGIDACTFALASQLDPVRSAAELVLRRTAAAWLLPAPAASGTLRIARLRAGACDRQSWSSGVCASLSHGEH